MVGMIKEAQGESGYMVVVPSLEDIRKKIIIAAPYIAITL